MLQYHINEMFIVRCLELNENSGKMGYRSKHFNIKTSYLQEIRNTGKDVIIDYETVCVKFKRECDMSSDKPPKRNRETIPDETSYSSSRDSELPDSELLELSRLLPDVNNALKEIGREQDFISVLKNIADKTITGNIALHLLLNQGSSLKRICCISMKNMSLFAVNIAFLNTNADFATKYPEQASPNPYKISLNKAPRIWVTSHTCI